MANADSGFPNNPDEVTCEWLTDLLSNQCSLPSDIAVADFDYEVIDAGFASQAVRFTLSYTAVCAAPDKLFGKFSLATNETDLPKSIQAKTANEVHFYKTFTNTNINLPRCYYANSDNQGNVCIILEHIDGHWPDQLQSATDAETKLVAIAMAQLHGSWWDKVVGPKYDWIAEDFDSDVEPVTLIKTGIDRFQKEYGEKFPALMVISQKLQHLLEKSPGLVLAQRRSEKGTLIHGDFRLGNICFEADQVVLADWQLVTRGTPAIDLTFWLCCNYTPSDRRESEEVFLSTYSNELRKYGQNLSVKKLKKMIRFQLLGRCIGRMTALSFALETVFNSPGGKAYLNHDMRGLEAMVEDYDAVGYLNQLMPFIKIYLFFRNLFSRT